VSTCPVCLLANEVQIGREAEGGQRGQQQGCVEAAVGMGWSELLSCSFLALSGC